MEINDTQHPVTGSVLKKKKTEQQDILTAQTLENRGTSPEATILQSCKLTNKLAALVTRIIRTTMSESLQLFTIIMYKLKVVIN